MSLISSGTAEQESAFLEASENGDDAFFITAQPLVAADHDTNYDLYDARVCTSELTVPDQRSILAAAVRNLEHMQASPAHSRLPPRRARQREPHSAPATPPEAKSLGVTTTRTSAKADQSSHARPEARQGSEGVPQGQGAQETRRLRKTGAQALQPGEKATAKAAKHPKAVR